MTVVYVPRDSAALSVGANAVAEAIARIAAETKVQAQIVRNGSRGMLWLEPLVEVETPQGRIAYGPVTEQDVEGLFAAGFLQGGAHALRHGPGESIPYWQKQTLNTFARVGVTDPLSTADYEANGGLVGLKKALAMPSAARGE